METGGIKRFVRSATAGELREFFTQLLEKYAVWVFFESDWKETAAASMRQLKFPFDSYRDGQRKLAAAVYRTVEAEGRLFSMAPTGVGKTLSALFPALKAMGQGIGEKTFYLTAKTVTRQAAQAALKQMRQHGLRVKSVTVTAKDKICFLEERMCKPEYCECADGHFDRINDAILDVMRDEDDMTAETVAAYAKRHRVCPFELALDLTLWSDVIICDYNYLFDPLVSLKRFFSDGGDYIFLIDEAHNLADRAREMYSASISKRALLSAGRKLPKKEKKLRSSLSKINKLLLEKRRECEQTGFRVEKEPPSELCSLLELFSFEFSRWLGENPDPDRELLETYFEVLSYLRIAEIYDEQYVTLYDTGYGGELKVKQFCADPSFLLDERLSNGRAAILFSATLTPAKYFMDVLGGGESARYLALSSPFPRENLLLLIVDDISTKYKDRDDSLERVADMIYNTSRGKTGNYIAYFPSYSYLTGVYTLFCEKYPDVFTVRQEQRMAESERDEFLELFQGGGRTMVAFCVLGGVFSEGIDLTGERLIGTVIVGVGLPQINTELDIVRDYYGGPGRGFDFAYRFPGMNKVLQAAGRVIRSGQDRGVVLLIDDRFSSRQYTGLFPEHWRHWRAVKSEEELTHALDAFWRPVTSSTPVDNVDGRDNR